MHHVFSGYLDREFWKAFAEDTPEPPPGGSATCMPTHRVHRASSLGCSSRQFCVADSSGGSVWCVSVCCNPSGRSGALDFILSSIVLHAGATITGTDPIQENGHTIIGIRLLAYTGRTCYQSQDPTVALRGAQLLEQVGPGVSSHRQASSRKVFGHLALSLSALRFPVVGASVVSRIVAITSLTHSGLSNEIDVTVRLHAQLSISAPVGRHWTRWHASISGDTPSIGLI